MICNARFFRYLPKTQEQVKSSLKKVHNASRVRFVTASLKVTEPQAGVMYLVVTKLLQKCQEC